MISYLFVISSSIFEYIVGSFNFSDGSRDLAHISSVMSLDISLLSNVKDPFVFWRGPIFNFSVTLHFLKKECRHLDKLPRWILSSWSAFCLALSSRRLWNLNDYSARLVSCRPNCKILLWAFSNSLLYVHTSVTICTWHTLVKWGCIVIRIWLIQTF